MAQKWGKAMIVTETDQDLKSGAVQILGLEHNLRHQALLSDRQERHQEQLGGSA
jgi:hypothetical protein